MRFWLVAMLMCGGIAFAEEARSILVVLKFDGKTVSFVSKDEETGAVAPQRGTPQMEPMFYEVRGEEGEVLYSDVIIDPRHPAQEGIDEETGKMVGGATPQEAGTTHLRFPAFPKAKTFTAYRRKQTGGEDDGDREKLVEVEL